MKVILLLFWGLFFHFGMAQKDKFQNLFYMKWNLELNYRLFKPHSDTVRLPLLVCLHGAGERGIDNEKNLTHFLQFASDSFQTKYPCYVLVPQCPPGRRWVEVDWGGKAHTMPEIFAKPLKTTKLIIDDLIRNEMIDTNRIYLTGLSIGGYGVWDLISRYPDFFAAAVPICGGGDEKQAPKLKNVAIWAFHGQKDKVVIPERTINMVNALKSVNPNVKMTIYPDVAHGAWVPAYQNEELFQWLFQQTKNK